MGRNVKLKKKKDDEAPITYYITNVSDHFQTHSFEDTLMPYKS